MFLDKRIGEKDVTLEEMDKSILRFQRERLVCSGELSLFMCSWKCFKLYLHNIFASVALNPLYRGPIAFHLKSNDRNELSNVRFS